jgi:hypothetical protein
MSTADQQSESPRPARLKPIGPTDGRRPLTTVEDWALDVWTDEELDEFLVAYRQWRQEDLA